MSNDTDHRSVVLRIRGHVQGVGFRVSARRMAATLGLNAEPVNEPDGSVRITVSGPDDAVSRFREWCAEGPELAHVDSVEEERDPM